jgi:hypothetical protein
LLQLATNVPRNVGAHLPTPSPLKTLVFLSEVKIKPVLAQGKNCRFYAISVAFRRKDGKAAALGLEPAGPPAQVTDPVTGYKRALPPLKHGLTHDPDLQLLVAHWYDFPAALRGEIVRLSRSWPREERPTAGTLTQ